MNKPPDLSPGEDNGQDKSTEKTIERPAMRKAIVVINRARWAWTFMIRCFSSTMQNLLSYHPGIALPAARGGEGEMQMRVGPDPEPKRNPVYHFECALKLFDE